MTEQFMAALREHAHNNNVFLPADKRLLKALMPDDLESDAQAINVYPGYRNSMLLLTSRNIYALNDGLFSTKVEWIVGVDQLDAVRANKSVMSGITFYRIELVTPDKRRVFTIGAGHPHQFTEMEIMEENTETIADELIELMNSRGAPSSSPAGEAGAGGPLQFDPQGPEKLANRAQQAHHKQQWKTSFLLYVEAVDALDTRYGYEHFKGRQPTPADAWIVQGTIDAAKIAVELEPDDEVRDGVTEAVRWLSRICGYCQGVGVDPVLYARAVTELRQSFPDLTA